MVSLLFMFYLFVILFAIIGFMRGWATEALVSFSVVLALFLITILETLILEGTQIIPDGTRSQFWVRIFIVGMLVFFGYQTPRISRLSGAARRERISDALLGIFLGAINGYLIFGTLWFYLAYAGYPFEKIIAPDATTEVGQAAIAMVARMFPALISSTPYGIYIAVGFAFLFILVVYI